MIRSRNILAMAGLAVLLGAAPLVNPAAELAGQQASSALSGHVGAGYEGAYREGNVRVASFTPEDDCLPAAIPRRLAQVIRSMTTSAADGAGRERSL